MIHGVVEMGRGQTFVPDHLLNSFPPLLVAGAKKAIDFGDYGLVAGYHRRGRADGVTGHGTDLVDRLAAMRLKTFVELAGGAD